MKAKFLFLFIVFSSAYYPQENFSNKNVGSKAVLFSIDGFKLNSFDGGAGIKFWFNKNYVVVTKVKFSHSNDKFDATSNLSGNETISWRYGAELEFDKHFDLSKTISPYVAVSIGFTKNKRNEKTIPPEYLQSYYTSEKTTRETDISANIGFGLEYFLSDYFSLAGAYKFGFSFGYGKEEYKTYYSQQTTMDSSSFDVGISTGELVFAVYF